MTDTTTLERSCSVNLISAALHAIPALLRDLLNNLMPLAASLGSKPTPGRLMTDYQSEATPPGDAFPFLSCQSARRVSASISRSKGSSVAVTMSRLCSRAKTLSSDRARWR